jgi:hypothetical protein
MIDFSYAHLEWLGGKDGSSSNAIAAFLMDDNDNSGSLKG